MVCSCPQCQAIRLVHDGMQWEKVKKAGLAPSPRTSFALAVHKKRAIIFGGVTDQHGRGDHMFPTLHDELYQVNFDSRRWYPVSVRAPPKALTKADNKDADSIERAQNAASDNASEKAQSTSAGDPSDSLQQTGEPHSSSAVAAASSAAIDGTADSLASNASHENDEGKAQVVQPDLADKLSRAGVDKQSALYKAAARIQSRFRGYTVRKVGPLPGPDWLIQQHIPRCFLHHQTAQTVSSCV